MRLIANPQSITNLQNLDDAQKTSIKNKQIPILNFGELLVLETSEGTLYEIETDQDIVDFEATKSEIHGSWKILCNQFLAEDTSLVPESTDLTITRTKAIVDILKLAAPITGTLGIYFATNFVTGIFLAEISTELLASMAIIDSLETPLTTICQSTLNAISPLIGRYKKISPTTVGKIMQQGYLLGLAESIPSILIRYYSRSLLLALGQSPRLALHAEAYFRASLWGLPVSVLVSADEQLLLAQNKKLLYLVMSMADLVVTLGLAYIFLHGELGFPAIGVASLGYTYAIRAWLSFCAYKLYFILNKEFAPYRLFNLSLQNVFSELTVFLRISLPIMLQTISKMGFMFTGTMLVGKFGISTLVSLQIVSRYASISILPVQAIALSTSILIGIAYGKKKFHSIERYGNIGILMGLLHTSVLFGICAAIPTLLAKPFLDVTNPDKSEIVALLRPFFMVLMGGQILESIDTISVGALRGLIDTALPMIIGIMTTWLVSFPLIYFVAKDDGALSVFAYPMIGTAVSLGLNMGRWYSQKDQPQIQDSEVHSIENTISTPLVSCIGFFKKPTGYANVPIIEEVVEEDEEFSSKQEAENQLDYSEDEDETRRCKCTLF
ncbi:MAG: hypothetical protein H0U57_10285 [Tatlockia sp.]|nr:hypothetical protein [Tatlockia sp.]